MANKPDAPTGGADLRSAAPAPSTINATQALEDLRAVAQVYLDSGLPAQVIAAWLHPFLLHLVGKVPPDTHLPEQVATLAPPAGVDLSPAV